MSRAQGKPKIAYLFFAYNNPQLIGRSIARLTCDDCSFFIHIDRKSRIEEFSHICGDNVFFSAERIAVYWAEFSGVRAILMLIRQALEHSQGYDYFVLLSGSEYPLAGPIYIHEFLQANWGSEFINMSRMPAPGKPISRITTLRFPSNKPLRRLAARGLAKIGLAQRDYRGYLNGLEPYSGHTWWALTRGACLYLSEFVECNSRITEYFENVFAPEETFFHTILGNSPFRSRVRRSLLYEDWSVPGAHPAMIADQHMTTFEARDKVSLDDAYGPGELLFARKFSDGNLELLRRMDGLIEKRDTRLRARISVAEPAPDV